MDFKKIFEDRGLSKYSIATYISQWNVIKDLFDITGDNIKSLHNPEKVYDMLKTITSSINSIKTKLSIIVVYLRIYEVKEHIILKYKELIDTLSNTLNKDIDKHEKTLKQNEGWLTNDDKIEIIKELNSQIPSRIKTLKDLTYLRNLVLFLLQQDLNTRNDLAESKIITMTPKKINTLSIENNWIVLSKDSVKYVINIYKTSKYGGQDIQDVNSNLLPLLKKYQRYLKKFNCEWLFNTDDGSDKLTRNNYGKIYTKIGESTIGKHITTTINRHEDASEDIDLIEKLQAKAKRAGHSLSMHLKYAKK